MNAVILTTVLSAGNSGLYASSRTLYDLALEGKAPRFFKKVTRFGVPIYCVLLTSVIGMLAFLTSLFGNGVGKFDSNHSEQFCTALSHPPFYFVSKKCTRGY